jgi:hypothetical protein
MNRTEQSKLEVEAELGPERARGVEVDGSGQEGVTGQDAVVENAMARARWTARFERRPVARPMETAKVVCRGILGPW